MITIKFDVKFNDFPHALATLIEAGMMPGHLVEFINEDMNWFLDNLGSRDKDDLREILKGLK